MGPRWCDDPARMARYRNVIDGDAAGLPGLEQQLPPTTVAALTAEMNAYKLAYYALLDEVATGRALQPPAPTMFCRDCPRLGLEPRP